MAYIPPQLAIDTERENQRIGYLNQAMDGFGDMAKTRQKALLLEQAKKDKLNAEANDFAGKGVSGDVIAEAQKTGDYSGLRNIMADNASTDLEYKRTLNKARGETAVYNAEELKKDVGDRDSTKKGVIIAQARDNAETSRFNRNQDALKETEQRRIQNEKQQKLSEAAVPEFDVADPDVVPTQKDAEAVKVQNTANKNFQLVGSRVADNVSKLDFRNPKTYISNDWKMLNQDITEMQLQAKELANLGVLNGPDLKLTEEMLGGLTPTNLALLGPKAASERVNKAMQTASAKLQNAASSRGYKQKSTIADKLKGLTPDQINQREAELLQKLNGGQP